MEDTDWAASMLECPKCGWEGAVVWPVSLEELECSRCGEKSSAPVVEVEVSDED